MTAPPTPSVPSVPSVAIPAASLRSERHRAPATPSRFTDGRRVYSVERGLSREGRFIYVVVGQGLTGPSVRLHDEAIPAANSPEEAHSNLAAYAARHHWVEVR